MNEAMTMPLTSSFSMFISNMRQHDIAATITSSRQIGFARYGLRVLPFIDMEAEEHKNHVGSNGDDLNMSLHT